MASSADNNTSSNDWQCTQTRGDRIEFEWTIRKFHQLLQKNGESIVSPDFPSNHKNEQWTVEIYPQGQKKEHAGWISIFLQRTSDEMRGIKVKCKFIVFQLNEALVTRKFTHKYEEFFGYGFPQLVKRSMLSVKDGSTDSITIHCKMDILGTYITSSLDKKSWDTGVLFEARKNRLTEDFQSFYKDPTSTDFTVISGDKKFSTHKTILASRSPVFAAMFQHKEMEENVKNELKIENITPDVVQRLLEFIYTDDVSEIEELADELLAAAEQYGLEGLKNLCEETLYKRLNEDNAAELLALADLHNATQLKKYVMQFIVDHPKKVVKSDAFKSMKLSEELSKEIIRTLVLAESEDSSE